MTGGLNLLESFDFIINAAGAGSIQISDMVLQAVSHIQSTHQDIPRNAISTQVPLHRPMPSSSASNNLQTTPGTTSKRDLAHQYLEMRTSYVLKMPCPQKRPPFPEIAILGVRGTEFGMVQVSPYNG